MSESNQQAGGGQRASLTKGLHQLEHEAPLLLAAERQLAVQEWWQAVCCRTQLLHGYNRYFICI